MGGGPHCKSTKTPPRPPRTSRAARFPPRPPSLPRKQRRKCTVSKFSRRPFRTSPQISLPSSPSNPPARQKSQGRSLRFSGIIERMLRPTPLVAGETYHIYNRGAGKARIFSNEHDCLRFQILLYLANSSESVRD